MGDFKDKFEEGSKFINNYLRENLNGYKFILAKLTNNDEAEICYSESTKGLNNIKMKDKEEKIIATILQVYFENNHNIDLPSQLCLLTFLDFVSKIKKCHKQAVDELRSKAH